MTGAEYAADLKRYICLLQAELGVFEAGAALPTPPDPISDHVVLRYMERVKKIDMRRLRAEILLHERRGLLKAGPCRIKCKGYDLICQKGVVVTVVA